MGGESADDEEEEKEVKGREDETKDEEGQQTRPSSEALTNARAERGLVPGPGGMVCTG